MSAADAPARQLARVRQGTEVGVIALPQGDSILLDARVGEETELLVARIGPGGGFCWARELPTGSEKGWLKRGDGNIQTANSRDSCPGWPARFEALGRRSG